MDKSNRKLHWEHVYEAKAPTEQSWYQTHPERSLELVRQIGAWLLSIYPVLARRRALAQRVSLLLQAQDQSGQNPVDLDPIHSVPLLAELTAELAQVRVDLVQSGITYYFDDDEDASALPANLPIVLRLGEEGMQEHRRTAVRFSATALREALQACATLSKRFRTE